MKAELFTGLLVLTVAAAHSQSKNTAMEATSKPVTCRLSSPELQKRKSTVISELKALVLGRKELSDGYAYTFDGRDQNLDRVTEFIKTERMCCDFFTFQLIVGGDVVVLSITGPDGAKEFLEEEVDL